MLPLPPIAVARHPAVRFSPRIAAIDTIVIHSMQGTMAGTEATFAAPNAQASAHYGIAKDGTIVRYLVEQLAGWHAGNKAVNIRSIGIELEATCTERGGPADRAQFTPAMMLSLAALCSDICRRHGVPRLRGTPGITMHRDIPDPVLPGRMGGAGHHFDPGPSFEIDALVGVVANDVQPPPVG
jgi:N-acetyl-anhydromuramyl-L-alanine amidase AmpD